MRSPGSTWVFVASFAIAFVLIIAANLWCFTILGEVNGRRPEKNQISIWQLRGRLYEVLRMHAALYPDSQKRRQMWTMVVTGAVFLFGGVFLAGFLNSH